MNLKKLVGEVAALCGHDNYTAQSVDLANLGVLSMHPSAEFYFSDCVPICEIDRPFHLLLSVSNVYTHNKEYSLNSQILKNGFVTFASEPDGGSFVIDSNDGRIHIITHEYFMDEGIIGPSLEIIPFTRESILQYSECIAPSITAFFESWREQLIEQENGWQNFLKLSANDPNAVDEFGDSLLTHCIREGELSMVKKEVTRGASIEQLNGEGRTALGEAVVFDEQEIVKFLIKVGADLNAANKRGITPLMLAAQYSQLSCAKLLLQAGADRNVKDCDGRAALDHVSRLRGSPEWQKLLSDN